MPSPKQYKVERIITIRQVVQVTAQTQKDALNIAQAGAGTLVSEQPVVSSPRGWSVIKEKP